MEDPDLNRGSATVDPGPLTMDMSGDIGLVDHPKTVRRCESSNRYEVHIGDGVDDVRVDGTHRLLAMNRAQRMGDVVPDDVIGVGGQRAFNVLGILCREMLIDDVQGVLPIRKASYDWAGEPHRGSSSVRSPFGRCSGTARTFNLADLPEEHSWTIRPGVR